MGLLVQRSDSRYHARPVSEHYRNPPDDRIGSVNIGLRGMPLGSVLFMAGIVEPILTSRGAMEINDNFDIMFPSPFHGFLEVWQLTANVRLSRGSFECPISYGESYVVESNSSHLPKVSLGNPSVPVMLESLCSFLPILALAEGPFVNKGRISRCLE